MNRIKEQLDLELNDVDFELDRKAVAERYMAYRKRKRTTIAAVSAAAAVIGLAAELLLSRAPLPAVDAAPDSASAHSFILAAGAAEAGEEYLETLTAEDRELLLTTQGSKIEVEYITKPQDSEGDGKTVSYKTFRVTGNTPIIVYGDGIEALEFHSDISSFFYPSQDRQVNDQRIIYDPDYPLNSAVYWLIPEEFNRWCEDMNLDDREVDFSLLPRDRVTVTAVFTDGAKLTRELSLWFNDYGYLVAETDDGTTFNNYTDPDEHNPFSYETEAITNENVRRITVALSEPEYQEIEVANPDVFISELWDMKLYEAVPAAMMNDKAPLITLEMADGSVHTVRVVYTNIQIDGGEVYRCSYGTADDLLSLCCGLLESNTASGAVFAELDSGDRQKFYCYPEK